MPLESLAHAPGCPRLRSSAEHEDKSSFLYMRTIWTFGRQLCATG